MIAESITSVKASPIRLSAETTAEDAFVVIINAALNHAKANLPASQAGQIEGVHQMRVAFRRLRSGLKLFRPLIPRAASATLVEEIRWLNEWLGPARDWDVFLEEGLPPIFARFPRKRGLLLFRPKAEAIRQRHHRHLKTALTEPRYQALTAYCANWLESRAWQTSLSDAQRTQLAEPAARFAASVLERHHRKVLKRGAVFARASAEERHALRIRIKETRYALDFFASLYSEALVKPYQSALAKLQDCLGIMNDIVVADRLLDEAGLPSSAAARQVIDGWYGCRLDSQEDEFATLWQQFMACERPWRD